MVRTAFVALVLFVPAAVSEAQVTTNPFPTPIESTAGVVAVKFAEFATIPDVNGEAPRLMHLVDEPGTRRLFVSTMRGAIYSVSYDGKTVTPYVDVNAPEWNIGVQFQGSERGLQSFVFHPEFNQKGARGFGRFYTYTDTTNVTAAPDFTPAEGAKRTHDTVLLEWTAKNPSAAAYDGGAPKELMRVAQPFANHNAGEVAFNLLAKPGTAEYGLLYVGSADGGSGGDPMNLSQNMASIFGKILRIDPLGTNSQNGKYGIPKDNPFVGKPDTLGEIYALGVRNPQRFSWDSKDGKMYVADIGQNVVEEISPVTAGANLGWNKWEGSFRYVSRQVDLANPRSEAGMTWPVAEYDHTDPLLTRAAVTGVYVYRDGDIKQLRNLLIFGDNPSGELFYVNADQLPAGGQDSIGRILFDDASTSSGSARAESRADRGTNKTLLQLIREKNAAQGKPPASRADLRLARGPRNQIFILNKRDGIIRLLVP
ncbi:MAG TPA: PQQ-dependent sugar dehydrogenase [Vicinamibacterales bacterium]|nr:PQQ-dependent sugar dehydrogenase [Vicinamibacterales bacterium]